MFSLPGLGGFRIPWGLGLELWDLGLRVGALGRWGDWVESSGLQMYELTSCRIKAHQHAW